MRLAAVAALLAAAATFAGAAGAYPNASPVPPPLPPLPPLPVAPAPPSPPAKPGALPPVAWVAPTPADGTTLLGGIGVRTKFTLRVADESAKVVVRIFAPAALPAGAALAVSNGNPAGAVFTWTPAAAGDYTVSFQAVDNLATPLASSVRSITIHVQAGPEAMQLSGGVDNISRWAYVTKPAVVRSGPSPKASSLGKLTMWTPENFPNLVLALDELVDAKNGTWVHVRLSKLPNNSTGWVLRRNLGTFNQVTTHLVVDQRTLRATLYENGLPIYTTIVGVGRSYWPTPHGEFYIREKITGFRNPMYGPIAFGTSAKSAVLTDWPGGGFIGIHGTNEPSILPGRVSHGCIRMRNTNILKLAKLLPVGTPLTVN